MERNTKEPIAGFTETRMGRDINLGFYKTGELMYEKLKTEKMMVIFDTAVFLNQRYKAAYIWAAHKVIEERTKPKS